jgi:hypothetical protein
MRTTREVQVDDQPDAPRWAELLKELPWDQVEHRAPQPDRYVYRIRCELHDVILGEPELKGMWRELVDRVRAVNERH